MNARARIVVALLPDLFSPSLVVAVNGMVQTELHEIRERDSALLTDSVEDDLFEGWILLKGWGSHRSTPLIASLQAGHLPPMRS